MRPEDVVAVFMVVVVFGGLAAGIAWEVRRQRIYRQFQDAYCVECRDYDEWAKTAPEEKWGDLTIPHLGRPYYRGGGGGYGCCRACNKTLTYREVKELRLLPPIQLTDLREAVDLPRVPRSGRRRI